jgi:hypothetical protein
LRKIFLLTFLLLPVAALAGNPAWDFTSPGEIYTNESWDFGIYFTPEENITVLSLGYFDDGNLTVNHPVGIFDLSGDLLVSALIEPSSDSGGCTDVGNFCYTGVIGTNLNSGQQYEIVGISGTDNYSISDTGFAANPNITYTSNLYKYDGGTGIAGAFVTPGHACCFDGPYFGPDFEFTAASTSAPEPGTFGVFGLGLLTLTRLRSGVSALRHDASPNPRRGWRSSSGRHSGSRD